MVNILKDEKLEILNELVKIHCHDGNKAIHLTAYCWQILNR